MMKRSLVMAAAMAAATLDAKANPIERSAHYAAVSHANRAERRKMAREAQKRAKFAAKRAAQEGANHG